MPYAFPAALRLCTLFASTALSAPPAVFHSDFETGQDTWSWYTHSVDGGGIRTGRLSAAQARRGRQSAQFVMDRSRGGLFHRAMFRKTDGFSTDRDEHWIGFSTAPAIDIGLYKWPWKDTSYNGMVSDVDRRVVYFDEFRLAGPEGSFSQVSVPKTTATMPVVGVRMLGSFLRFDALGRPR